METVCCSEMMQSANGRWVKDGEQKIRGNRRTGGGAKVQRRVRELFTGLCDGLRDLKLHMVPPM